MGRRASSERETYWRSVISQQKRSGLSIAAFCRKAGISERSFYSWRRRLVAQSGQAPAPQFVPISISPAAQADFEIRLPGGVSVVASSGFDESSLRRLLQVVAGLERDDA